MNTMSRCLSLPLVGVAALVLGGGTAVSAFVRIAEIPTISQAPAETELEGKLDVIIEDSAKGSRTEYFLTIGDRRVHLRFASAPPPNLTTGTRVRVRGRWQADGTLVVSGIERL